MKKNFLLLAIFFLTTQLNANNNSYFAFTPVAKKAFQQVSSLRFQEAYSSLAHIKIKDPDNLIVYHIENYIDFLSVFLNEDVKEFKRLEKNKNIRLNKIKSGNKNSPYYLFVQAEIHLQWAMARLKYGEYITAFNETGKAFKLLKTNQKKFPNFIANKKSLGLLHAVVGTIPDSYKWGVKLLGGLDGTIEQGKRELEEVLTYAKSNQFIFEEETLILYAFLMLYLKNDEEKAWHILKSSKLDPKTNPLATYALANMAMKTGRNDEAINFLLNKPVSKSYHPFYFLDFLLGVAKLNRLDNDADKYLKLFVQNFKGRHQIKKAYQKLAWFQLIHGDVNGYNNYMSQCKTKGESQLDGDKNALRAANKKVIPNQILLKARLLFDGGYYRKAYQFMIKNASNNFIQKKHQLEFTYRLGRILHKMKNLPDALEAYQSTINSGKKEAYYYACNSALQMGFIFEKQKQYDRAYKYYKLCLSMRPEQYKNSLHQKAKAGLNRLKSLK